MDAERSYHKIDPCQLAAWHFEDEQLNLAFEQQSFSPKTNDAITEQLETVTADPMPFFIQANEPNGYGVLLVHGLLASPAELREYGHYLADLGYTVLGIRIQGHGTSPYALRELTNQQWYQSVQKGFSILQAYCARIFVIGFSTGGALALKLAEENPDAIIGVVAVSVPIKFVNSSFMLVPLVHNTNTFVQWMSSFEGVKPFIENSPEHPDINYHNTPIRALYELRLLIQDVEKRLPNINTPTLLIYADQDPVVAISSADTVFEKLGATQKKLHVINADNHGILMENTDNIWRLIDDFLKQQSHLVENLETQAQTQPVREIVT